MSVIVLERVDGARRPWVLEPSVVDLEKSLFLIGPGRTTLPIAMVDYLDWSLDPAIAAIATIQIAIILVGLLLGSRHLKLARTF